VRNRDALRSERARGGSREEPAERCERRERKSCAAGRSRERRRCGERQRRRRELPRSEPSTLTGLIVRAAPEPEEYVSCTLRK